MTEPNISDDFSIDDIHKIREHNHEHTKKLSAAERCAYYRDKAWGFLHEAGITPKTATVIRK